MFSLCPTLTSYTFKVVLLPQKPATQTKLQVNQNVNLFYMGKCVVLKVINASQLHTFSAGSSNSNQQL